MQTVARTMRARAPADRVSASAPRNAQGAPTGASALLAYSGALPLIVAAVIAWVRPDLAEPALLTMVFYGSILLVFFGGVRWGVAVMREGGASFGHLVGAIIPALLALPVIAAPSPALSLGALALVLPLLLLSDLRATRAGSGAPAWYLGVRVPLTLMMETSVLIGLAAALL